MASDSLAITPVAEDWLLEPAEDGVEESRDESVTLYCCRGARACVRLYLLMISFEEILDPIKEAAEAAPCLLRHIANDEDTLSSDALGRGRNLAEDENVRADLHITERKRR